MMKKFLSIFAFTAMLVFTAFAPHAFANVNINIDAVQFDLPNNQIILNTTVANTIDQPVHLNKFQVNNLKIFDGEKNLLWEGSVTFEDLDVPIPANGSVQMTFTLHGANPPDYTGATYTEDDSFVFWTAEQ